jgi:hypothetical protein
MNCVKNVGDIKAHVITSWDHPRSKFKPGDSVIVRAGEGANQEARVGTVGTVVAVSAVKSGHIRGRQGSITMPDGRQEYVNERMYTRYYVQFEDDCIFGIHSHFLKKLDRDWTADELSDFSDI